jgi:hypothetical protein
VERRLRTRRGRGPRVLGPRGRPYRFPLRRARRLPVLLHNNVGLVRARGAAPQLRGHALRLPRALRGLVGDEERAGQLRF